MAHRGFVSSLLAGAAPYVLAALLTHPAAAQEVRDLDSEASNVRSFSGNVGAEPAMFEATVQPGTMLRIDAVTTSDLDPKLTVTDAANGEILGEDDDGGGELNARVTVRGAEGRRIRISVQAFNYDALAVAESAQSGDAAALTGGSFDLRLTTTPYNPQSARAIGWGKAVGGTLLAEETNEFSFTGEAGQVLDVVLLAGEDSTLDPFLELKDETGEVIASNDDSGGGLNARLRHVFQDNRTYTIVAKAYSDSSGDYTLRVAERRQAVEQAPLQIIGIGGTAEGRLGEGLENGGVDPAFIEYQLDEQAIAAITGGGGQVTIHMDKGADEDPSFANSLDPFVQLGFDTPLGFAAVGSDDDSGGNLSAMLPIDLSSLASDPMLLGRLRIRAQAFSGSSGNYVLRVTEGMEALPVAEESVELEEPVFN